MQLNRLAHLNIATARRLVSRAAIVAVIAMLALPLAVLAHAHLRRSEPAARDRLSSSPTAIRLWFSERPEIPFTHVRLRAADSSEITLGAVTRMSDDALGLWMSIPTPLSPGVYTVLWRTAAADGHATNGSYSFEVVGSTAPAPVAASVDTGRRVSGHALVRADSTAEALPLNVTAATRWLEFIAMLAVVGAVVFRMVVMRLAERTLVGTLPPETRFEITDSGRRFAQSALVLLLIAMLSRLYYEASTMLGPNRPINRSALRDILFGTSWGAGWLVGLVGIALAALGFSIVRRVRADVGWTVAALGALAIIVSPGLTGHARATPPVALSLGTDILHVGAVCAWQGTLLVLLFASVPFVRGRRAVTSLGTGPLVAGLVRAFHPVALTCAVIVVITGTVAAWLRLPTFASLWESTYGRVLLLKLAFVAIVVVLGLLNWRRMLPALGDERSAQRITRTAGAELTIAVLVLAVTAVLVSTSPSP